MRTVGDGGELRGLGWSYAVTEGVVETGGRWGTWITGLEEAMSAGVARGGGDAHCLEECVSWDCFEKWFIWIMRRKLGIEVNM